LRPITSGSVLAPGAAAPVVKQAATVSPIVTASRRQQTRHGLGYPEAAGGLLAAANVITPATPSTRTCSTPFWRTADLKSGYGSASSAGAAVFPVHPRRPPSRDRAVDRDTRQQKAILDPLTKHEPRRRHLTVDVTVTEDSPARRGLDQRTVGSMRSLSARRPRRRRSATPHRAPPTPPAR
jgi:hypothetical protein